MSVYEELHLLLLLDMCFFTHAYHQIEDTLLGHTCQVIT